MYLSIYFCKRSLKIGMYEGVTKMISLALILLKYTQCDHFTFLCPSKYSQPASMHFFRRVPNFESAVHSPE